MAEAFVRNHGVGLHVIESGADRDRVPLLIVPGMAESAHDYADLVEVLAPRRCVAVTLRGRTPSDAPRSGYTLADHVSDIATAVGLVGREKFCLFAFSRGVAYGLGYAVENPGRLAGLILADYPARHPELPPEFPGNFLATSWRGKPAAEAIAAHALRAIQREAREVVFWDRLAALDCPAAILHGDPVKGSLLLDAHIDRYRSRLRHSTVIGFPDCGHDLREPDPSVFHEAIGSFMRTLDEA